LKEREREKKKTKHKEKKKTRSDSCCCPPPTDNDGDDCGRHTHIHTDRHKHKERRKRETIAIYPCLEMVWEKKKKRGLMSRKKENTQTVGSPSSSSTETQRGSAVCTKYCFAMLKHINTSYT
jgi:hypothetical protein